MKFNVTKTSHKYYRENDYLIELNSLEEFIDWCKKTNHNVIVKIDDLELEIYDDWRE